MSPNTWLLFSPTPEKVTWRCSGTKSEELSIYRYKMLKLNQNCHAQFGEHRFDTSEILDELANRPPPAALCSPFGVEGYKSKFALEILLKCVGMTWCRNDMVSEWHGVGMTWCRNDTLSRTWKFFLPAKIIFISSLICLQTILLSPQWSKDSKYVLRFEIWHQEGGEKIGRTSERDRHTNSCLLYTSPSPRD